jgi:hypothetical protein
MGARPKGAIGRVKQLMNYWTAGGLITTAEERAEWMQLTDFEAFEARLRAAAAG